MGCAAGPFPKAISTTAAPVRPWQMPTSEYPSQRLYRLSIEGKKGSGSAKVTLRYWAPGEYEARAADALGRPIWVVAVDRGGVMMVDERAHTYCEGRETLRLPVLDFGPLPLEALPRLLIGRLPLPPATRSEAGDWSQGRFHFTDSRGRSWRGELENGWPLHWTMGDPEPLVWWQGSARGGVLSRRGGGQVRWRQEVREPLPPTILASRPSLSPPTAFEKVRCHEPALP